MKEEGGEGGGREGRRKWVKRSGDSGTAVAPPSSIVVFLTVDAHWLSSSLPVVPEQQYAGQAAAGGNAAYTNNNMRMAQQRQHQNQHQNQHQHQHQHQHQQGMAPAQPVRRATKPAPAMNNLAPHAVFKVMNSFKGLQRAGKEAQAKAILMKKPDLVHSLLQAQLRMGMVDTALAEVVIAGKPIPAVAAAAAAAGAAKPPKSAAPPPPAKAKMVVSESAKSTMAKLLATTEAQLTRQLQLGKITLVQADKIRQLQAAAAAQAQASAAARQ